MKVIINYILYTINRNFMYSCIILSNFGHKLKNYRSSFNNDN